MPFYRIYPVNSLGRTKRGFDAFCDDDQAACLIAWQYLARWPQVEVWQRDRCLGRLFDPKDAQAWPAEPAMLVSD